MKISVIIPIYNSEKYLRDCLDSVLSQTLEDIEIICINDGSVDGSLDILKGYAEKDKRIVVLDKANEGVSVARNIGINKANGEFVCFMDSDDLYPTDDVLETLYSKAKENHVLVAGGEFSVFDENIKPYEFKQKFGKSIDGYLFSKDDIVKYQDYQFDYGFHRFIFAREFLIKNNISFPLYTRLEDPIFFIKVMHYAKCFYALNKITYGYRNCHKQVKFSKTNAMDALSAISEMLDFAQKYGYKKLERYVAKRYYEHLQFIKATEKEDLIKRIEANQVIKKELRQEKRKRFLQKFISLRNDDEKTHKIITLLGMKIKLKNYRKVTNDDILEYIDYVQNKQLDKSDFINLSNNCYKFKEQDVKLISFYLPQFHDFEENIKWFGRGFTEWSNTSKAVPQFTGHYQPHIPIDVGYYNLNDNSIMRRQIELAKQYGIYGFSFYYYWFSGKKLMEKPLERFLQDKSLNMPFFLFWANEDWTMLWDNGKDREILHKQKLLKDDEQKFMKDILPYMKDDRYIKINNKPLLIIYNPHNYPFERYIEFNKKIRQIAKGEGFDDLFIMTTTFRADCSSCNSYQEFIQKYNLDSLLEFFPQGILTREISCTRPKIMNKKFKGKCYDMHEFITHKKYLYDTDANLYKCAFPHWDNTPRKCYNGADIYQNTPKDYKIWLKDIISWTKSNHSKNEQFVFINAWNEWAEGAHLEPDQKYGYAYLQATKEALEGRLLS